MVGDRPVFEAQFLHVFRDFFQRVVAVAPVRVVVQRAFQIRPFDQFRQVVFLRRRKFAVILAQFRRHKRQVQFRKNVLLGLARHEQFRVARFLLRFEQAVFIQPQPALDRPLAHHDVVLLAAGEIRQRERKFRVAHHAQIALDAAFQNHARLGFAFGQ